MRVKICGIRDLEELKICLNYADAVGFVTEYPLPVPWNISRREAKELISKTPLFISTVVVTSGSVEKVLEIAKYTQPDVLQLHGRESEKEVGEIAKSLKRQSIKVIKALPVDVETGKIYDKEPLGVILSYAKIVDAILLDSWAKDRPAGTGKVFDWSLARQVRKKVKTLIIAGGLDSQNVRDALEMVKPYGVDVISGVERKGRKDEKKIQEFVGAARMRG